MTPERFERLKRVLGRRQPDLTVLMDNVHKPHNLAAVMRTCDAVGILEVHGVFAEEAARPSRAVAQGAQRWVHLEHHATISAAAGHLRGEDFRIVAAHPAEDAIDFREYDYTQKTALLLGQELDGISRDALDTSDDLVVIPMKGFVASLNVSVAAALILFEAQRQRELAGMYGESRIPEERRHELLFEWAYPQIARLCRERGIAYPRFGEGGEILDPLPFTGTRGDER
ncbi:MAG: tRNA (guanosine(18)-2'-O)-methyltransferase TrmH [Thermoanaerobaculia bacterium]|nr:tRNA (guanosine(18)-2'-O)-methyltransferase TrmH [Thermoanaerobaculia bacterium]